MGNVALKGIDCDTQVVYASPKLTTKRCWFSAKQIRIDQVNMLYVARLEHSQHTMLLTELEVQCAEGSDRYQLPLAFLSEAEQEQTSALPCNSL